MRQCSVASDRNSSRSRKAATPTTAPMPEPSPPSTVMKMRSPERCQVMKAGLTNSVWFAKRNPATPHSMPATTKAVSWKASGLKPSACMRTGFSRLPRSTRPNREPTIARQSR